MSAILMSDDQASDFVSRLKILNWVVGMSVVLVPGVFAIGIWVSKIQAAVFDNARQQEIAQSRLRALELNEATNAEKLRNILTTVERIDRKLNKSNE